jgi:hypothetical protein
MSDPEKFAKVRNRTVSRHAAALTATAFTLSRSMSVKALIANTEEKPRRPSESEAAQAERVSLQRWVKLLGIAPPFP